MQRSLGWILASSSHCFQDRKDSVTYDYAQEEESEFKLPPLPHLPDGHYEFDTGSGDEPFWEPASVEDELKNQLQHLTLTQDTLSWVWSPPLVNTMSSEK